MAGKSYDFAFSDCDEAGDGLAAERDLDFAGPSLAESFPHPSGDLMLFRGQRAPHDDARSEQPLKRDPGTSMSIGARSFRDIRAISSYSEPPMTHLYNVS